MPKSTFTGIFMVQHLLLASGRAAAQPAALVREPPGAVGANWTAHRLLGAVEAPERALCLDGSPPLYYLSPGSGDGVDKWEIHMEGGESCGLSAQPDPRL